MRKGLAVLAIAVSASSTCMLASPAAAQVSFGFSSPGVSIGVNLGSYPELVRIPGYPVYYAPSLATNYFFYDGMYWVFDGDNWFASTWYNGPWEAVPPDEVPLFLLRVPVRYYVAAPVYFRSWSVSGPPRWGEHWGRRWEEHHRNWDRWDRSAMPAPAPLPTYQRAYAGDRYPGFSEQHVLERQHYNYRPHDRVVQQAFNARVRSAEAAPQGRARQGSDAEPGQQTVGQARQGRAQPRPQERAHAEAVPQEQTQARIRAENQRAQRAQQTQQAQVRQQEQAQVRQQEQGQRGQQAQAQQAQQAQARQQEQAQRAQQAQARQQEQAQRAQQAQAQRAQQAQAHQQEQAQRAQQAQAQRAQQAQARQQEQAQRAQQAQAQRAQQAQAQHAEQAQAQREQQNGARGRAGERRDEHNG